MTTTAVVAEILIVGLGVEAWLALLLLAAFGPEQLDVESLRGWQALITVLVLALAYLLGILTDRLIDTALRRFDKTALGTQLNRWSGLEPCLLTGLPSFDWMRLVVMDQSEGMAKFLDYQRSRLRVARASMINVPLVSVMGALFLALHANASPVLILPIGIILAAVLLSGAFFAYARIRRAYELGMANAYGVLKARSKVAPDDDRNAALHGRPDRDSAEVVAAVCYSAEDKAVEFLLVNTKGGGKRTFPKGHVKRGEQPTKAAAREALEEAGVRGDIETEALTHYLYPSGSGLLGDREHCVTAYLMEVKSQGEQDPEEHFREPGWFDLKEAEAELKKGGRERKYVREHSRVLREAVRRLEDKQWLSAEASGSG